MQGEKSLSAARSAKARASRKSSAPDAAPRKSQSKATAALEAELQRAREQALRALAELENHRKRAEKERAEAHKYGAAALATDLLSVADNLRRALDAAASAPDNDAALPGLLEGVRATERELQNVFRRHHIEAIDPKGEAFDPHCHEALYEVESREQPPGTVLEVVACGYRLEERLLRPARVGVAKAPAGDAPAGETPAGETPLQSPPAKPDNS